MDFIPPTNTETRPVPHALRIANTKWQDMIPNTEVLQRCAQTGIEQHIKRAQLRCSGHLVRMAGDRIPKDMFYGELDASHWTRGGQRKVYKDVLKATLKSCAITPGKPPQQTVPSGVVPAIPVYETTKRRGATPWGIREWDGRLSSLHQTLHRCQPSRNRAGIPAFWRLSRMLTSFPHFC